MTLRESERQAGHRGFLAPASPLLRGRLTIGTSGAGSLHGSHLDLPGMRAATGPLELQGLACGRGLSRLPGFLLQDLSPLSGAGAL